MTSLFSSTCDLAARLPPLVADFLDLEISLRRRFREESVTDLIVASLIRLSGPRLSVQVPVDEAKTGNDFDIVIFDPMRRTAVQYRIQAKRLTPHRTAWDMGSYVELAHPNGTGAQSLSLVRSAAAERKIPTVPLYAFYNPARACDASGGLISGIEMADGRAIRAVVRELIRARPKRPPLKRLSTLHPLFFPLSRILCPPTSDGDSLMPSPEGSLQSVADAVRAANERFIGSQLYVPHGKLADLRGITSGIGVRSLRRFDTLPPVLAIAMARRSDVPTVIRTRTVDRPKIVLFSGDS
ncbi:DUF6615 family protein [Blastomonas sp. UPD001]|uniref:DUF6615 family protein n=1 Tax=Blastomonas sp. UPD001 TaxID=2217673 RepID=UPI000E34DD98|nr:DUF6615 family protein [Blastomonas sp. UPD001]